MYNLSPSRFVQIGHDEILNIVEDWGPTYEGSVDPLPLNGIPITCLKPLALLFGGVGDGEPSSLQLMYNLLTL